MLEDEIIEIARRVAREGLGNEENEMERIHIDIEERLRHEAMVCRNPPVEYVVGEDGGIGDVQMKPRRQGRSEGGRAMKWKLTPAEPTPEMQNRGCDARLNGEAAAGIYHAMLSAAPDPLEDAELVERVAAAMRRAVEEDRYGLYDYSRYTNNVAPHVVRDHHTYNVLFRSHDCDEAERFWKKLMDEYPARAAITAMKGE